jgi:tRNA A-37 threonylcarbamoyl transferase component Bud32
MAKLQLLARTGHPDFLDLPWSEPLAEWQHERLVEMPMGLHRHVVRPVAYEDRLYHLKELPRRYALREWRFLRHLKDEGVPVVDVVGVVTARSTPAGEPLEAVLITEHLEFSVPYRLLFLRQPHAVLRDVMLDALAQLLVRIHLNGFLWGDCSLSNTLFRRDAGRLSAYVVDTETGELYDQLTDGQRAYEIELAIEKCAGELYDLQAAGVLAPEVDPIELGDELRSGYAALWDELTRDEVFADDERYRIHDRLGRINELGYDVEQLELVQEPGEPGLTRMRLRTSVLEPGRDRRLLRERTGLDAQDNQARRLLNDICNFGAWLEQEKGHPLPQSVIDHRWMEKSFEPTVARVPEEMRGKRDPAEVFIEVLDHWHHLSEVEGSDLPFEAAAQSYVDTVLRFEPEERRVSAGEGDAELDGYLPDPLADTMEFQRPEL